MSDPTKQQALHIMRAATLYYAGDSDRCKEIEINRQTLINIMGWQGYGSFLPNMGFTGYDNRKTLNGPTVSMEEADPLFSSNRMWAHAQYPHALEAVAGMTYEEVKALPEEEFEALAGPLSTAFANRAVNEDAAEIKR